MQVRSRGANVRVARERPRSPGIDPRHRARAPPRGRSRSVRRRGVGASGGRGVLFFASPPLRAGILTRRTPSSTPAAEGLARARRRALGRVAHGGGVLLRREVRREGEVRRRPEPRDLAAFFFPAPPSAVAGRATLVPRVACFPADAHPPPSSAQGEALQAHQLAPHGVRDSLGQGVGQGEGE